MILVSTKAEKIGDARQAEKKQIILNKNNLFWDSLVPKQQMLCEYQQRKTKTSTNAAIDGPQG